MEQFRHLTGSRALDNWLAVVPWPIHQLTGDRRAYRPNPALAAMLGFSVEELDSTTLDRCITDKTRRKLAAIDNPTDSSAATNYIELSLVYRHRDGIEIEARRSRIGPFDAPSTPVMVMLEGLVPSRRLDRADIQSRFSRLIAHDLNNVFTIAQSYVDLARRQSPTARLSADYLERAARSIRRGIRISAQLQTIALDKPFPVEESSVTQVIEGLQPFLGRLMPTGPKWSIDCDQSLPDVLSHPAKLSRFVIDFTINAHLRWPHSPKLDFEVRRSPGDRATVMMRIAPPQQTAAALQVPFRLFLCRPDPFSPDTTDPLFVSDIIRDDPISLDLASQSMTALLPAIDE